MISLYPHMIILNKNYLDNLMIFRLAPYYIKGCYTLPPPPPKEYYVWILSPLPPNSE
jgi:hypothetical protein